MRVLSVVDGTGWSGTKEQTFLIARGLSKRGFDVHLLFSERNTRMRALSENEVNAHLMKGSFSRLEIGSFFSIFKLVKGLKPDVLIANSPHSFDMCLPAIYFLRPKVIAYKRTGLGSSWFSKKFKYRFADKIVVVDKRTHNILIEQDFYPEKLIYIPSGIDLNRFFPNRDIRSDVRRSIGISDKDVVFINVANWDLSHKGQDILIKAFGMLRCENCVLLLVGEGTDKEGMPYAKALGIKNVIGLGFRGDIERLLQSADFFVFSSRFEGIAGAVLQAMACGLLVISSLVGGVGEYLKDGENSICVPVGDAFYLSKGMKRALEMTNEERSRLTERALQTAMSYSIDKTLERYVELLEGMK
ncbi:MAG: glycosyltransferase family 4 protein [Aquificaceae bacterium]|nr:glycosyltransferase family 4 protein [Aquificaceae bacterium]MDW8237404.1 glycosyltransferase family 4 protein [Aquificaceae bacterium]